MHINRARCSFVSPSCISVLLPLFLTCVLVASLTSGMSSWPSSPPPLAAHGRLLRRPTPFCCNAKAPGTVPPPRFPPSSLVALLLLASFLLRVASSLASAEPRSMCTTMPEGSALLGALIRFTCATNNATDTTARETPKPMTISASYAMASQVVQPETTSIDSKSKTQQGGTHCIYSIPTPLNDARSFYPRSPPHRRHVFCHRFAPGSA